ncbi:hypothetical protein C6503_25715 [Candidatus Poribacteria bacterium]|nr:MAG: hypothetical protein C6503_25715 [Candidatus Poribacteria bacterium]
MSVLTQILMQGAVDRQGLRDIKPPLEVPQALLFYFIGAAVILGVITVSAWFYLRKRPQTLPVLEDEAVDVPLPHEVAYEQLAAIETSDLLKRGDMETYHTRIAYVLREYISGRYQIPALELTTTALLHAMLSAQIGAQCVQRVQQLLVSCDMVKFATYQPELSEASARIADARWIVDETKVSER